MLSSYRSKDLIYTRNNLKSSIHENYMTKMEGGGQRWGGNYFKGNQITYHIYFEFDKVSFLNITKAIIAIKQRMDNLKKP